MSKTHQQHAQEEIVAKFVATLVGGGFGGGFNDTEGITLTNQRLLFEADIFSLSKTAQVALSLTDIRDVTCKNRLGIPHGIVVNCYSGMKYHINKFMWSRNKLLRLIKEQVSLSK